MNKFIVSTLLMSLTLAGAIATASAASVGSGGAHTRVASRLETSAAPSRTAVHMHVRGHRHHRHHAAVASMQRDLHPQPAKPASMPPRPIPHRSTMPVPVSHTRLQHQTSHRGGDPGAVASAVPFACLIGTCPIAGSAVQRLPDRPDVVTSGRGPPRGSPIEASGPIERPDLFCVAPPSSSSCDAVRLAHPRTDPPMAVEVVPTACSRVPAAVSARARSARFAPHALACTAAVPLVSLCKPTGPCDRSSLVARGRDGVTMHALSGGIPCPA
jgi:hypothetical protein